MDFPRPGARGALAEREMMGPGGAPRTPPPVVRTLPSAPCRPHLPPEPRRPHLAPVLRHPHLPPTSAAHICRPYPAARRPHLAAHTLPPTLRRPHLALRTLPPASSAAPGSGAPLPAPWPRQGIDPQRISTGRQHDVPAWPGHDATPPRCDGLAWDLRAAVVTGII